MADLPLECVLMLGYAMTLALIALLLEWVAGHAHRRSLRVSTAGLPIIPIATSGDVRMMSIYFRSFLILSGER